jgi:hypothetical protein
VVIAIKIILLVAIIVDSGPGVNIWIALSKDK